MTATARISVMALLGTVLLLVGLLLTPRAWADEDDGPITVVGGGRGDVHTGIVLPGGGGSGGGQGGGGQGGGGGGSVGAGTGTGGGSAGGSDSPGILGGVIGAIGGGLTCTVGETVATNPLCPPPDPAAPAAPPPPNPADLAATVRADLVQQLPQPSLTVSPDLPNTFNAEIGYPVTVVNLWFWFWADDQVWQPMSDTLTAGGVSVTTTATPVTLTYDPGNGASSVVCDHAGREWTEQDANINPAQVGGCGFMYEHVTADGPITGELTITWLVTWQQTAGGAAAGQLAPITTTTQTPEFMVAQIQVVNE